MSAHLFQGKDKTNWRRFYYYQQTQRCSECEALLRTGRRQKEELRFHHRQGLWGGGGDRPAAAALNIHNKITSFWKDMGLIKTIRHLYSQPLSINSDAKLICSARKIKSSAQSCTKKAFLNRKKKYKLQIKQYSGTSEVMPLRCDFQ